MPMPTVRADLKNQFAVMMAIVQVAWPVSMSSVKILAPNCRLVPPRPNAVFWTVSQYAPWFVNVLHLMCPTQGANVNNWSYKLQLDVLQIPTVPTRKPASIANVATLAIVVPMPCAKSTTIAPSAPAKTASRAILTLCVDQLAAVWIANVIRARLVSMAIALIPAWLRILVASMPNVMSSRIRPCADVRADSVAMPMNVAVSLAVNRTTIVLRTNIATTNNVSILVSTRIPAHRGRNVVPKITWPYVAVLLDSLVIPTSTVRQRCNQLADLTQIVLRAWLVLATNVLIPAWYWNLATDRPNVK